MVESMRSKQAHKSVKQVNESKRQVHGSLGFSNLSFGDGNHSDGELYDEFDQINENNEVKKEENPYETQKRDMLITGEQERGSLQNFEEIDLESVKPDASI